MNTDPTQFTQQLVGYASLGRGFLSGLLKSPDDFPPGDQRRDMPRFQGENFRKNLLLVEELKRISAELRIPTAALAIAWCLRHGNASPIVGATEPAHVDDAMVAVTLQLPANTWDALDALFPVGAAAGERYPEAAMRRLQNSL